MDVTGYKITDVLSGRVVRVSTVDELLDWVTKSYTTLTKGQEEMIACLGISFKQDDDFGIKWYGAACDLLIEPKKKKRTRRTKASELQ